MMKKVNNAWDTVQKDPWFQKLAFAGQENFMAGFYKRANAFLHGTELAGLGILGVPSAQDLANPKASAEEKRKAKYELGGLGVLALPSAWAAAKGTKNLAMKYGPKVKDFIAHAKL